MTQTLRPRLAVQPLEWKWQQNYGWQTVGAQLCHWTNRLDFVSASSPNELFKSVLAPINEHRWVRHSPPDTTQCNIFTCETPTCDVLIFSGTRSWASWTTNLTVFNVEPVEGTWTWGSVWGRFRQAATTAWDWLQANSHVLSPAQQRKGIVIMGHSLGAAVAEIVAYRLKQSDPSKMIVCYKYGSPRVGGYRWARHVLHDSVKNNTFNIYTANDPVYSIPVPFHVTFNVVRQLQNNGAATFLQHAQPLQRFSLAGEYLGSVNDPALSGEIYPPHSSLGEWLSGTPQAIYWHHSTYSYRTMSHNLAMNTGETTFRRFNHIRFAGDTQYWDNANAYNTDWREYQPEVWG